MIKDFAGSAVLPLHIPMRIQRPSAIRLIDRNKIGVVDHVDFFELRLSAEFGGHHVHAHVGHFENLELACPIPELSAMSKSKSYPFINSRILGMASEISEPEPLEATERIICAGSRQCIHPNSVSEQSSAGPPLGGINANHADARFGKVMHKANQKLVDQ